MGIGVKRYRCKHGIEVMAWNDTDADREAFADWFDSHDTMFKTHGPIVVLPEGLGEVSPGELIAWSCEEFIVMTQDMIDDDYEAVPELTCSYCEQPLSECDGCVRDATDEEGNVLT